MHPVFEHDREHPTGCSFAEFQVRFTDICQEHRDHKRAMLFAFILHDMRHPYQSKVLHDKYYWAALDQISGNRLTVFSFIPHRRPPMRRAPKTTVIQFMTSIDLSPGDDPYTAFNETFNLHNVGPLPGMVFFQVHNSEVIDSIFVPLIANGEEAAFNEIEQVIKTVLQSISGVLDENYKNSREIFNLAESALNDDMLYGAISRGLKGVMKVKDFLSLFSFAS